VESEATALAIAPRRAAVRRTEIRFERTGCRALIATGTAYGFWPVVKMSDGTYRKGPFAEIVGWWSHG
jgi:hypothetical protein